MSSKRDCVSAFVRFVTFLMIPLLPGKTGMENELKKGRVITSSSLGSLVGFCICVILFFSSARRGSERKVAAS
jgi:hypothetical protein